MTENAILVINAGSSSIKFAIFPIITSITKLYYGMVDHVATAPELIIHDVDKKVVFSKVFELSDYEGVVANLITSINTFLKNFTLIAVGHRVVHGGTEYLNPILINDQIIEDLTKLIPLAPLHQPYNLKIIVAIRKIYPNLKQVACFDTAFHATQSKIARMFGIPRKLSESGVIKYGFHGLSYEYISTVLPKYLPEKLSNGKILIAHLGNGASACAMNNKKSVATSMGFTALEGLMMGSRCGNIDPGVVLYLLDEKKLSVKETTKLLYSESGMLGVSGISSDLRELESSSDPHAKEAIDLFCYKAARELLALCTILKGLDAIVFTAGIGEHAYLIRQKICEWLSWLGVSIDIDANKAHANIISDKNSKITVAIIPTNEELMIVQHTMKIIEKKA